MAKRTYNIPNLLTYGRIVAVPLVVRTINAWLVTASLSRKELAERLSGRRPASPGKAGATAVPAPSDARRGFGPLTVAGA